MAKLVAELSFPNERATAVEFHRQAARLLISFAGRRCGVWRLDDAGVSLQTQWTNNVPVQVTWRTGHEEVACEANRCVWTADLNGQVKFSWRQDLRRLTALAWRRQGDRFAVGLVSGGVLIMDPSSSQPAIELKEFQRAIRRLAWSPDGRRLAATDRSDRLVIWSANGKVEREMTHESAVQDLAWAADGDSLATAEGSGAIHVWPIADGETLRLRVDGRLTAVAYDGRRLAAADEQGVIYSWRKPFGAQPQVTRTKDGPNHLVRWLGWEPAGGALAAAQGSELYLIDNAAARRLCRFPDQVIGGDWLSDGRLALACGRSLYEIDPQDDLEVDRTALGHLNGLACVAAAADERRLSAGADDCSVHLFDRNRRLVTRVWQFLANGQWIAFDAGGQRQVSSPGVLQEIAYAVQIAGNWQVLTAAEFDALRLGDDASGNAAVAALRCCLCRAAHRQVVGIADACCGRRIGAAKEGDSNGWALESRRPG